MIKKVFENPNIYLISIPLPDNPLKNLNCYVVKAENESLIIDTGFNMEICYEALTEGLDELNIDLKNTKLFLTHMHSDHTGLAWKFEKKVKGIWMSKVEYEYMEFTDDEGVWGLSDRRLSVE